MNRCHKMISSFTCCSARRVMPIFISGSVSTAARMPHLAAAADSIRWPASKFGNPLFSFMGKFQPPSTRLWGSSSCKASTILRHYWSRENIFLEVTLEFGSSKRTFTLKFESFKRTLTLKFESYKRTLALKLENSKRKSTLQLKFSINVRQGLC